MTAGYRPGRSVFANLTFSLPDRGLYRIDAPNGTGKSTAVELMSGYLRPLAGTVTVLGQPAHNRQLDATRRVCRSSPGLFPEMTVSDHLAFTAKFRRVALRDLVARAATLSVDQWLDSPVRQLSSGTARKLWITMCLAGGFRVAVLDEVFVGLDAESVNTIVDHLIAASTTALVVIVAHDWPSDLVPDGVVSLI